MKNISLDKLNRIIKRYNLKGQTFIGMDLQNRPQFLTEGQRSRHVEIIGLSGCGKTSSVILPMIFQDICEEKCVISIDGKGDLEFAEAVYASLLIKEDFKNHENHSSDEVPFLYLNPALPEISNTYNPVYTHPKTDLDLLKERVFRAFQITHEHWGPLGLEMLKFLVRSLYATGRQFNLSDIYVCLKSKEAREFIYRESQDREAVQELKWHFEDAKRGREDAFAQFKVKLSELNIPVLNDYNPDIIPEELVEGGNVLCVSLPESYKTISYGIGNMLMEDFKVAVSKRFLDRTCSYPPCDIYMDEIQSFLNPKVMLSALAQFRGANCQLVFAHQSKNDLRVYNPAVADTIWVNSQMKVIFPTNDPEISQTLSDIIGTEKRTIQTHRTTKGPFLTTMPTFEASNQEADAYERHPNFFKKMKPFGQGFLLATILGKEKTSQFKSLIKYLLGKPSSQKPSNELYWTLTPLNFARFPKEFVAPLPKPQKRKRKQLEGLNLYKRFVAG